MRPRNSPVLARSASSLSDLEVGLESVDGLHDRLDGLHTLAVAGFEDFVEELHSRHQPTAVGHTLSSGYATQVHCSGPGSRSQQIQPDGAPSTRTPRKLTSNEKSCRCVAASSSASPAPRSMIDSTLVEPVDEFELPARDTRPARMFVEGLEQRYRSSPVQEQLSLG